ncbi:HU family DNA-binding protein [Streptomyces sp. Amel2xC10]|uniref:HU family DNA-binding protein n=1 Tax=Streptomyces sp. Amel2xC10 TaxID=1305826 RepID=UPI000A08A270|nr:HU family DNA-binding protein [Streptomyces sp. Amel2xC10]SMF85972.1 nucleoid DNA-binding protein [Streptomyces sp. Amel2xC10]
MSTPTPITKRLTMTSPVEIVASDLDTTPDQVRDIILAAFDAIARAGASGHDVAVTNFGTWRAYRAAARLVRNPQNGGPIPVPEHNKVRFHVSPHLAAAIRRGDRNVTIRKAPSQGAKAAGR